ncbi:MAG: YtxH domain-containing protein [Acidobacteriota bacterium]
MKTSIMFLLGLMIGALTASGMMLFMAPMSGKKMRSRVKDQAEDLQDAALERAMDIQEQAQKLLRKQNKKLTKQALRMKEDALDTAVDLQDRGQKILQERTKSLLGRTRKTLNHLQG